MNWHEDFEDCPSPEELHIEEEQLLWKELFQDDVE